LKISSGEDVDDQTTTSITPEVLADAGVVEHIFDPELGTTRRSSPSTRSRQRRSSTTCASGRAAGRPRGAVAIAAVTQRRSSSSTKIPAGCGALDRAVRGLSAADRPPGRADGRISIIAAPQPPARR